MKPQIKSRYDDRVLYELECDSIKECVVSAVKSDADLRGAYLYGADLRGADLGGANLYGADLRGADLGGADLRGADLGGAYLGGANLRGANLYGANLRGANLRGANLYGADLRGAYLRGAYLRGAYLGEKFGKLLDKGYFSAGPLGSREDYLQAFHTEKGIFIKAGCFFDSLEAFRDAVTEKHGETSKHGKLYLGMANVIEFKFAGEEA